MNETFLHNPSETELTETVAAGIALLRIARENPRRQINADDAEHAIKLVLASSFGVKVIDGGTKASSYPATTSAMLFAWHTRLSGEKVVKIALYTPKIASEASNVVKMIVGPELQILELQAGPLLVSTALRELWEFADVPTGDEDLDSFRFKVRSNPEDMAAWESYADALRFRGEELNEKNPQSVETIAEVILQRVQ